MALKSVVIDAGHGGVDTGATGNGIIEKNLTLDISKYMFDRFKELGIPVKMTRTTDETLGPDARPQRILNQFGNSKDVIVISNHINAGGGEGAEVIYALRNNGTLASNILSELEKAGQIPRKYYQRRLPSDSTKDYYYVIRNTPNTETLIVEYGFLDNAKDATKLKNNYKNYAEAVVRAVAEYGGYNYVPLSGSGYYTVKKGDTLWSIARNFGLTVNELKELNSLSSNTLSIGDTLLVNKNNNETNEDTNNYEYYTVVKGDTLYEIANKYGLTVNELKALNNLTSNNLSIGQRLIVGKTTSTPTNLYTVQKGDTLYSIAKKYNVSVDALKSINNLNNNTLSIGQTLIIPTENQTNGINNINSNFYEVKKGDTLYNIAKNFNTTVAEIKELNNLISNVLSVGQQLLLP